MPGQRLCLCNPRRALRSGGGYTAGGRGYSTLPHARHAGGLDFRGVSARLTGDTLRRGDLRQGASGMTLNQLFDLSLCQRRDETGLEWQGRSFTFGEIGSRARRLASTLRSRGFRAGDRLAVQLANCVELIDLYLACLRLGVIFVPVNVLYREREVIHSLQHAAPRFFVTQENLADLIAEAGTAGEDGAAASLDGDSPAALVYTSGTTGASKGAILTHNNFAANAINLLACWQITAADRFLLALPLFHVHALGNGLHCWMLSGCRMRQRCRCSTCTRWATACTAGCSAAAACACWSASSIREPPPSFWTSGRHCSSACRPSIGGSWRPRRRSRARLGEACGSSSPDLRRCLRR